MITEREAATTQAADSWSGAVRACLLVLSFFGGFQIMVLEVCGFRVLQTHLGSSVLVTGTLLTMIMVVLSIGYYLGGVLSHAVQSSRALLLVLVASVVYTHLVDSLYLESIADLGYALRERLTSHLFLQAGLPAAALSVVLYGPPVLAMSMISPFLIRLETDRRGIAAARAGKQSGFFMSLSTVGSIAGTLLASYLMIPLWGVRTTVAVTSALLLILLLVTLLLSERSLWRVAPAAVVLVVLGGVSVSAAVRAKPNAGVIYEAESFYGNIRVVMDKDAVERPILAYRPSRVYTHSVVYPNEPLRELPGLLYLLPAVLEPPKSILVLGSAAGGILRQTELLFPKARVVGVDLDPGVHDAAVRAFGVDPDKSELVADDARAYLATHEEQFDFIIVDLFAGEFIPSHCITTRFFELVKHRLAPAGSLFVNTNMNDVPFELAREGEPFRAFRHLASTLRAAGFPSLFENHYFHALYAFPRRVELTDFQQRLEDLSLQREQPEPVRAAAGLALYTTSSTPEYGERYRPFTDEWSPELMIELKTNEQALFEQLGALPRQARQRAAQDAHPVAALALAELLEEGTRDDYYGALHRSDFLLHKLNGVQTELTLCDRDLAARYLHFGFDEATTTPRAGTPWAKLSLLYARLYTQAYENDYEALLTTLPSLSEAFRRARAE